jgi:hypothetical protein
MQVARTYFKSKTEPENVGISEFVAELFKLNAVHKNWILQVLRALKNPENFENFINFVRREIEIDYGNNRSDEINVDLYAILLTLEEKIKKARKDQPKPGSLGAIPKE